VTRARVLVIEDEAALADVLADNLREEGLEVLTADDGEAGARAWREERPDLVVLDVMLPRTNGFALCERMRQAGDDTPVLYLSARGDADDRVRGLAAGGDDYLPKPFHLPEFLLRVRALLRRRGWGGGPASAEVRFAGHRVDLRSWTAELADGRREPMGEREFHIFRLLSERAGQVVSRDDILDAVWGGDAFPSSRTVDNFVVRLRKLFEPDPSAPRYFHTVWGVGYRFTPEGEADDAAEDAAEDAADNAAEHAAPGAPEEPA